MFFLFWWLLWPLTAPVRAFIGTGRDQYFRETVLKFWSIGVLLTGSLFFFWTVTGLVVFLGSFVILHFFYGLELRKVVLAEQGVDLFG